MCLRDAILRSDTVIEKFLRVQNSAVAVAVAVAAQVSRGSQLPFAESAQSQLRTLQLGQYWTLLPLIKSKVAHISRRITTKRMGKRLDKWRRMSGGGSGCISRARKLRPAWIGNFLHGQLKHKKLVGLGG